MNPLVQLLRLLSRIGALEGELNVGEEEELEAFRRVSGIGLGDESPPDRILGPGFDQFEVGLFGLEEEC